MSDVLRAPKSIVGVYMRVSPAELRRLTREPGAVRRFDTRAAIESGTGLDLGHAWEALAVLIDGGIRLPETGPTLGELPLPDEDPGATWSYVPADRVPAIAAELREHHVQFARLYVVDGDDTDPYMLDLRTGGYPGYREYLLERLDRLAAHYEQASIRGEALVVRIGESV